MDIVVAVKGGMVADVFASDPDVNVEIIDLDTDTLSKEEAEKMETGLALAEATLYRVM